MSAPRILPQPIAAAARELGVSESQLRRYLAVGAPQARRGRRGAGGAALLDPAAIAAWRAQRAGTADTKAVIRNLASELPQLIGAEIYKQFRAIDGPHKRPTGQELARTWFSVTTAILDRMRRDCPDLPELCAVPLQIESLTK